MALQTLTTGMGPEGIWIYLWKKKTTRGWDVVASEHLGDTRPASLEALGLCKEPSDKRLGR